MGPASEPASRLSVSIVAPASAFVRTTAAQSGARPHRQSLGGLHCAAAAAEKVKHNITTDRSIRAAYALAGMRGWASRSRLKPEESAVEEAAARDGAR